MRLWTRKKQKCVNIQKWLKGHHFYCTWCFFFFRLYNSLFNTAIMGPSKFTQGLFFFFFKLLSYLFLMLSLQSGLYLWMSSCFILLSVHIHGGAGRGRHLIHDPADVTGYVDWALLVHLNERISLRWIKKKQIITLTQTPRRKRKTWKVRVT